jgi:uncharacterized SAM-binding protein YcdF (DUF218 family)
MTSEPQGRILKRISFKDSAFGWDGLSTFIFSNLIMVITAGLFLLWLIYRTLHMAITSKIYPERIDSENRIIPVSAFKTILIAGLRLENNLPTRAFKCRLQRAVALKSFYSNDDTTPPEFIILGGVTGDNQVSEAQAGANYLIEQGVDGRWIKLEQQSRHTLENMQHARSMLLHPTAEASLSEHTERRLSEPNLPVGLPEHIAIITSRFHLYRIVTLARGLNMNLQPVAAEEAFTLSLSSLFNIIREAYYLHWYWSGKLWVFITANDKSKARIT